MEQDREQTKLKAPSWNDRLGLGDMPASQQTGQTQRSLERVLKIVVSRINGLVVIKASRKTLPSPFERARHKGPVAVREQAPVNLVNRLFHLGRVTGIDMIKH